MATRRQLTSGAATTRNHGQDTAENDLVICEGDLLVNTSQYRRCARPPARARAWVWRSESAALLQETGARRVPRSSAHSRPA